MEMIKQEIIHLIEKMSDESIEETKQQVDQLFEFIKLSHSIWGTVPDIVKPSETVETETSSETMTTLQDSSQKIIATAVTNESNAELGVPLDRKLKGGILKGKNGDVFIPEKLIRTHGFVHGDYIEAIGDDPHNLYFIKRRESTTAHECNRVELSYCLLSTTSDGYLVANQRIMDGKIQTIKLDGETPYQFLIKDNEIQSYQLQQGSVVAIAYFRNNPSSYRVVWQYPDYTDELATQTPKPSSYYKESSNHKENKWNIAEEQLLKDKNIVIVGADFRSSDFIALADEADFTIHTLSGDENRSRFEAAVRNVDLIISASAHSSHRSSKIAKDYAKKYNIPFRAAPTSQSSIKKAIVHGIKESYIPFHSFF
ncbi:DUF2325 domain-containing protein [Sporosarcina sp. HYO08]|uniref:DUF2325 domain-containing protein n=1 Tax=Sporosarcina sp. HYO08 TaxID=1759557 RepID=UPI00079BB909|nr:DUF2325 domain-containing protein [Sporosarcina sp. HYO08]KXH87516.1 hypothetical protein AU377_02815 [Sporosarcina sp. HYO08]